MTSQAGTECRSQPLSFFSVGKNSLAGNVHRSNRFVLSGFLLLLACFLETSLSLFFFWCLLWNPYALFVFVFVFTPGHHHQTVERYLTCSQPHVLDLSVKNSPKCVNSCLNFMYQFFLTSLDDSWASLLFLSPEQLTVHLVLTREKTQFIWCSWKPKSWFFNNILEFILKRLQTI